VSFFSTIFSSLLRTPARPPLSTGFVAGLSVAAPPCSFFFRLLFFEPLGFSFPLRQKLSIGPPDSRPAFNPQPSEGKIVILCAPPVTAHVGQAHGLSKQVPACVGRARRPRSAPGRTFAYPSS